MSPFDILVAVILGFCVIQGIRKGFALQLSGILALVLAFTVARPLSGLIAPLFGRLPLSRILAWIVAYGVLWGGSSLFIYRIRKKIIEYKLEGLDRRLGALLGFIKGVLLLFVLVFVLVSFSDRARDSILRSPSGIIMGRALCHSGPLLPGGLRSRIEAALFPKEKEGGEPKTTPPREMIRERREPRRSPAPR